MVPLRAGDAQLVYSPANLAPLVTGRRNVIVIHDAAPFSTPEAYSTAYGNYHRMLAVTLARRARHLITVSEFSRHEITRYLGVPAERISVIAPGVDRARFTPSAAVEESRRRLGLQRPYVLSVGTDSARKNRAVLTPAARALAAKGIEFVVAGGGRDYLKGTRAPGLRRLGYVPDDLLPGLYAGALAFVMPSIHEGFGLPCIEAMACGTPVVAADAGALPETCEDGALLIDAQDADGFMQALLGLATEPGAGITGAYLSDRGLKRAAEFSWERTATQTDRLLSALLD